LGSEWEIR